MTIESWLMLTLFTDLWILNPRSTLACLWLKTKTNLIIDWISGDSRSLREWKKNLSSLSIFESKTLISLNFGNTWSMYCANALSATADKMIFRERDDEGRYSHLIVKSLWIRENAQRIDGGCLCYNWRRQGALLKQFLQQIDNHLPAFLSKYTCRKNCNNRLDS